MNRLMGPRECKEHLQELGVLVVVPTFNNAGTVGTLMAQLIKYASDILVVDDGCTDGTEGILGTFGFREIDAAYVNGNESGGHRHGTHRPDNRADNRRNRSLVSPPFPLRPLPKSLCQKTTSIPEKGRMHSITVSSPLEKSKQPIMPFRQKTARVKCRKGHATFPPSKPFRRPSRLPACRHP